MAAAPPASSAPWDRQVKVGKPYQVDGVWYYPRDDRRYDETGIASWYGPGFHAKSTANGETYNQDDVSAAHKTLPMPSYVRVENLENGRQLVVRVNDRGPFVEGRIIDLSRRSAQLLGVDRAGLARVRVRRVEPTPAEVAALRPQGGVPAAAPPPVAVARAPAVAASPVATAADPGMVSVELSPPPATTAPAAGNLFIQVAAVADEGRATWLAGYLTGYGPTRVERIPSGLHRVRIGPFATVEAAQATLSRLRGAGYEEALVVGGASS